MKAPIAILIFAVWSPHLLGAQVVQGTNRVTTAPVNLLNRHYQAGETLSYHMKAANKGFLGTLRYEAEADGVVKTDSKGHFFEEYAWTNLVVDGKPIALPAAGAGIRQSLSLDPGCGSPGFPDPLKANPHLHAPMMDFYNFYVDLQLATRLKNLTNAGDHVFLKYSKPASWAHGSDILGEDSIDFDITLKEIDRARQVAVVLVRHVPSEKPQIKIPAAWMRAPVSDTPNNWVQVTKNNYGNVIWIIGGIWLFLLFLLYRMRNSRFWRPVRIAFFALAALLVLFIAVTPYLHYMAMVGKETFDCEIKVSLANGRIISATMDNPVEVVARPCADEALTKCGPSFRGHFIRKIEIY